MQKLMSQKYAKAAASYEPAMTFEEIGAALGIRKQAAYFLFVSALKKLRKTNSGAGQLFELAQFRERERQSKSRRTVRSEVA